MKRDLERQGNGRGFLGIGLVVLILAVWVVWWQWDSLVSFFHPAPPATTVAASAGGPGGTLPDLEPAASSVPNGEPAEATARWEAFLGQPPVWPGDLARPAGCENVAEDFERLCSALDTRAGANLRGISGGPCGAILHAADALAARRPVLSAELKSHTSIVANVFHFYRIVGTKRFKALRELARLDPDLAEPAAMMLFRRLITRRQCDAAGMSPVRPETLYDYSSFLFNTLGGQAYLRRRSPRIEALVSFYALLSLDRALEENHNPHGIDPRPEIGRTRELIAGQTWVFRDEYLRTIDGMQQRWDERATPAKAGAEN